MSDDLLNRLSCHIGMMAPHQKDRYSGRLLIEAAEALRNTNAAIVETLNENRHLCDGEKCTLKRLKDVVSYLPPP